MKLKGILQQNVQEYKEQQRRLEEEKYKQSLEEMKVKLKQIEDIIIDLSKQGKTSYCFSMAESFDKSVHIEEVKRYFEEMGLNVVVKTFPLPSFSDMLFNFQMRTHNVYQVTLSWK